MSPIAFFGAVEIGLIYGLVGIGVLLTFRHLNFPDLTVEGSFPLGSAVTAAWIVAGGNPWFALIPAFAAGVASGLVTAWLSIRLKILHILAGILTMIALFSINIRVMGKPNLALLGEETIITPLRDLDINLYLARPLLMGAIVILCLLALGRFLLSDAGLTMRATGGNARMVRSFGSSSDLFVYIGVGLSNGIVALAGALFAQSSGFADVTSGVGTIVVGIAAVILGEAIFRSRSIWLVITACVIGSLVYRLAIAFALSADLFGLKASDLNLVTSALVIIAMVVPQLKNHWQSKKKPA